jgi:hypothetical protein
MAERNTAALRDAPLPRTQTKLRSFLGLCNVYSRFDTRFAAIAAPLKTLFGKRTPATLPPLTTPQIEAFKNLRNWLLSPPILALPRSEAKFNLWVDTDSFDGQ